MIAEPYIYSHGPKAGTIEWSSNGFCLTGPRDQWQSYTDFEREKLKELGMLFIMTGCGITSWSLFGYADGKGFDCKHADIRYTRHQYDADSESGRLLKRAEFLKAVCEKEGVEWLPSEVKQWEPTKEQQRLMAQDYEDIEQMLTYHREKCTDPDCSCKPKDKPAPCERAKRFSDEHEKRWIQEKGKEMLDWCMANYSGMLPAPEPECSHRNDDGDLLYVDKAGKCRKCTPQDASCLLQSHTPPTREEGPEKAKVTVCDLFASNGTVPCIPRCKICSKHPSLPGRDTYTKQEIDERMLWILEIIGDLNPQQQEKLRSQFRNRFLPPKP